jgi:hypothetical protein
MNSPRDHLIPWEEAVKLTLLGVWVPTPNFWVRYAKLTIGRDYYVRSLDLAQIRIIKEARKALEGGTALKNILHKMWWPAPSYDQTLWVFRNVFKVDFEERPTFGLYKGYYCNTIGSGDLRMDFPPRDTPQNARLQAIQFLLQKVKPFKIEEVKKYYSQDPDDYNIKYTIPEFESIINNLKNQVKCQELVQ